MNIQSSKQHWHTTIAIFNITYIYTLVTMASTAIEYLLERSSDGGAFQSTFEKFTALYNKKQWHPLTVEILSLLKNQTFLETFHQPQALEFYHRFISTFSSKMNPLSLAVFVIVIAQKIQDPNEAIDFMNSVEEKVKTHVCANVSLKMKIAEAKLAIKDLDGCKEILDSHKEVVESSDEITLDIHADYFRTFAAFNKQKGQYSDFYKNALRYLGCFDNTTMHINEQQRYAADLCISALVAEEVYNVGELVLHPILETLVTSPYVWLHNIIHAFNKGDLSTFESLQNQWTVVPEICENYIRIRQKIMLMALLAKIFQRPTDERTLTFIELSEATHNSIDQIEDLVMKALSLNLVRGSIDEINQTVTITWVQPRVLDHNQLTFMCGQMNDWCNKVENCLKMAKQSQLQPTEHEHEHNGIPVQN